MSAFKNDKGDDTDPKVTDKSFGGGYRSTKSADNPQYRLTPGRYRDSRTGIEYAVDGKSLRDAKDCGQVRCVRDNPENRTGEGTGRAPGRGVDGDAHEHGAVTMFDLVDFQRHFSRVGDGGWKRDLEGKNGGTADTGDEIQV